MTTNKARIAQLEKRRVEKQAQGSEVNVIEIVGMREDGTTFPISRTDLVTDKTASELAIKRLREELEVLWLEARNLENTFEGRYLTDPESFFESFKRGVRWNYQQNVINDYMRKKNPTFLPAEWYKWKQSDYFIFLLSSADFEEIEHRSQVLFSMSVGEERRAYGELNKWCQQLKTLMQHIKDKSNELKLHEQRVKM